MYTPKAEIKIVTREGNLPVKLVGTNAGLLNQVLHNRTCRRYLNDKTHTILLIEVEVAQTVMHLDSDALLVRFFGPVTKTEKWAIRTAEKVVMGMNLKATGAWVNELLWMTYTGTMRDDMDRVNFGDWLMYQHWTAPSPVIGTWNTYERSL